MNAQRGRHHKPVTLAGLQIADRTGDITDAVNAAIEQAGWVPQDGPRYRKDVHPTGRWRWSWAVVNDAATPPETVASGRVWSRTRDRAWRRAHRAYVKVLNAPRAES